MWYVAIITVVSYILGFVIGFKICKDFYIVKHTSNDTTEGIDNIDELIDKINKDKQ